jgi:hypothetical protein
VDAPLVPAVAVLVPTAPVIERVPQLSQPPSHEPQEPQPPEQSGAGQAEQVGAGQSVGLGMLVPLEVQTAVPEEEIVLYSPQPAALNALTLILKEFKLYCVLSTAEVVKTSVSELQVDPLFVVVW